MSSTDATKQLHDMFKGAPFTADFHTFCEDNHDTVNWNALFKVDYSCDTTTPLHEAAKMERSDFVSTLCKHGADPNLALKKRGEGETPMHVAARHGFRLVVDSLLEAGAKNTPDALGRKPSDVARQKAEELLFLADMMEREQPFMDEVIAKAAKAAVERDAARREEQKAAKKREYKPLARKAAKKARKK